LSDRRIYFTLVVEPHHERIETAYVVDDLVAGFRPGPGYQVTDVQVTEVTEEEGTCRASRLC
jgi:hypothetical protein